MRIRPRRQPYNELICILLVLLVYGVITWHVFGWDKYRSFSTDGSSDSSLSHTGNGAELNTGEDGEDSLDHFLESILIEGFPTHLKKKERKMQAGITTPKLSSSNKASGSFRRPRLRGT